MFMLQDKGGASVKSVTELHLTIGMNVQDLVEAKEGAQRLKLAYSAFVAIFRPALVVKGRAYHPGKYSRTLIAAHISEASGHSIAADELGELIPRAEAMQLVADMDRPRSLRQWCYWKAEGKGPDAYMVGRKVYYRKPEVTIFAQALSYTAGVLLRGKPRKKLEAA